MPCYNKAIHFPDLAENQICPIVKFLFYENKILHPLEIFRCIFAVH